MSIVLMSAAFKAQLPSTQKFVLVALCDSANDQGECYPSVPTLMEKCSLSERGVQVALSAIEAAGGLRREFRNGRSTVYWLTPAQVAPRTTCTPAPNAPPHIVRPTPAPGAPPPPHQVHPTPAPGAPITVIETNTKTKTKNAHASVHASVLIAAGFDAETADEFIAIKAKRKAPLTERAWRDHLAESKKAGWSPLKAAEKVMAKTWKGFEAKYVADEVRPVSFQSAKATENGKWLKGTSLDPDFIENGDGNGAQLAIR